MTDERMQDARDRAADRVDRESARADRVADALERSIAKEDRIEEAEEAILMRDALVAGLAGAASDLDNTGRELLAAATWARWQKALMMTVIVMNTIIMITLVVAVIILLAIANSNRANTEATKKSATAIESCTTPQGECYQRGQAQTATAVNSITTSQAAYLLIALECSEKGGGEKAVAVCFHAKARLVGLEK